MNAFCMSTTTNAVLAGSIFSKTCERPRFAMTRSMTDCGMDSLCMGPPLVRYVNLSQPASECIRDEGMRERVTVTDGSLVLHGHTGHIDLRVGAGARHIAEA